jgi:hypothetical protein
MKIIVSVALILMAALSGCRTIESRTPLDIPPKSISVEHTVKVEGYGLDKNEWVELPAGVYTYRFSYDSAIYYMCQEPQVVVKTRYPERPYDGGICYSRRTGRYYTFAMLPCPSVMPIGPILYPTGAGGRKIPALNFLISDKILALMKDEANQALVPTATSVTPAADAPVAPAAAAAHL